MSDLELNLLIQYVSVEMHYMHTASRDIREGPVYFHSVSLRQINGIVISIFSFFVPLLPFFRSVSWSKP